MELRHIRYLIAAAEEEHFGRAAERLSVTRSAVSQIVSDLEKELGVQLFDRQAQKVRLTSAGRAMLPRLNALMVELNETIALGKRVSEGKSGLLRVGYGSLSTHHPVFRAAIKRFHDAYPDVVLSLVEIPTSRQMKAIDQGLIHAGFMHIGRPAPSKRDVSRDGAVAERRSMLECVIDTSHLGVIVPDAHRWANRRGIRLAELAQEPLVMVYNSKESPAFRHFFTRCDNAGFEPRIIQEVSATVTQQDLVLVGVGVGITVVGGRHTYPPGLKLLRISDVDDHIQFQLVWSRLQVEPALLGFVETIRSVLKGEA